MGARVDTAVVARYKPTAYAATNSVYAKCSMLEAVGSSLQALDFLPELHPLSPIPKEPRRSQICGVCTLNIFRALSEP